MLNKKRGIIELQVYLMFWKETKMKMRIIVVAVTLLTLLTSAFCLTGCNTWKGLGKDVETTGEKMQGSDKD